MKPSTSLTNSRGLCIWPGMIFVLIGINVCVVAITVYFAHADRSFAVEQDYYQRAVEWSQTAQQNQRNRELDWGHGITIEPDSNSTQRTIVLRVWNADGIAIEQALVNVNAFPSAQASHRQDMALTEQLPGEYRGVLTEARAGVWEFRVVIRRGDDVFTA